MHPNEICLVMGGSTLAIIPTREYRAIVPPTPAHAEALAVQVARQIAHIAPEAK